MNAIRQYDDVHCHATSNIRNLAAQFPSNWNGTVQTAIRCTGTIGEYIDWSVSLEEGSTNSDFFVIEWPYIQLHVQVITLLLRECGMGGESIGTIFRFGGLNPRLTGAYPITRLTGGGYLEPPPISETTGPIFKIQRSFDSSAKTVEWNLISLTSRSPMTSQVRSVKIIDKWSMFTLWGGSDGRWTRQIELKVGHITSKFIMNVL